MAKNTWQAEAAKKAGNIVGVAIAALAVVASIGTYAVDVVPDYYKARVVGALAFVGALSVALTKVQATLTRDRVWSQDSVDQQIAELLAVGREVVLDFEDFDQSHPERVNLPNIKGL